MIVRSRNVAVLERGAGPAVVLVHSSGMSSAQWGPILPRLAPLYSLHAPDLLGYGGTDPWPDPDHFDLAEDVAIVDAVLAEVGDAHLVGHSYGGLLALHAAAGRPVRSLSVFEPVAFGVLHGRDPQALANLAEAETDALYDVATGGDAGWMQGFVDWWGGPGAWARLPPPRQAAMLATGRKTFLEVRALMHDHTPAARWATIGCPTLVMSGTRSPLAARSVARILADTLPHADLAVIEGAGHMAPIEASRAFGALLLEFFGRMETKAP
jgi:pimeloyl-ACP methyl ester carboxylesterase